MPPVKTNPSKPYQSIPIRDCGEPLTIIPPHQFAFFDPHPYLALGAPYGHANPWMLRASVLAALQQAQQKLQSIKPNWKIMLFDAYRPNAVQAFMVQRELHMLAQAAGLDAANLSPDQHAELMQKVLYLWGIPSDNPTTPPPHSTGAAIDCTIADDQGNAIDMGSPIDENSDRSRPDYFAQPRNDAERNANANRVLLNDMMSAAGFHRHLNEWWHFSRGDQSAVFLEHGLGTGNFAVYGRAAIPDKT